MTDLIVAGTLLSMDDQRTIWSDGGCSHGPALSMQSTSVLTCSKSTRTPGWSAGPETSSPRAS